eukprot:4837829-Pyramimonas_sp.AAC.1
MASRLPVHLTLPRGEVSVALRGAGGHLEGALQLGLALRPLVEVPQELRAREHGVHRLPALVAKGALLRHHRLLQRRRRLLLPSVASGGRSEQSSRASARTRATAPDSRFDE